MSLNVLLILQLSFYRRLSWIERSEGRADRMKLLSLNLNFALILNLETLKSFWIWFYNYLSLHFVKRHLFFKTLYLRRFLIRIHIKVLCSVLHNVFSNFIIMINKNLKELVSRIRFILILFSFKKSSLSYHNICLNVFLTKESLSLKQRLVLH